MSVTTADEYRTKNPVMKVVDLPSGAKFEIRKMSIEVFSRVAEMLGLKFTDTQETIEQRKEEIAGLGFKIVVKYNDLANIIFPSVIITPKVTLEKTPGTLTVSEIDPTDGIHIINESMSFSGLSAEAKLNRESFRTDPSGKDGGNALPPSPTTT